jgi:type VI secretion system protein ImpM
VPAALTGVVGRTVPRRTVAGFCGKIPARGDFVRSGLPRAFTDPWDDWLQRMLLSSREMLGEGWLAAWLEGPVWRFALVPGVCGPAAVLGLWLPSVDRAGRFYPLTLAALSDDPDLPRLIGGGSGFFGISEPAGREAVAHDLPPEALAARLDAAVAAPAADPDLDPLRYPNAAGLWWTEGAPRVPRGTFACDALPDENRFAAMLDASALDP